MRKSILGLSLLTLAAALDFQWSYEGQEYWATEVDRIDKKDNVKLKKHIEKEGLGYFRVGDVDWPQFCHPMPGHGYEPGAYVVASVSGQLVIAKAYQLMDDPAHAFMTGVIPDGDDSYKKGPAGGIPIPPALGSDGPLAGVRFAVKDIYHVKGVKTTGGSRAYHDAFPPQNHTSSVVLRNLAAGATLVGKTKTVVFALAGTHNGWSVDYHDPFNLRADGYITTGGSSSGSLAAEVAYDWVDFTIGTDTAGSIRGPAGRGGLYGYRPTHGAYDMEGVLPCIHAMDTPGFFTRSPTLFSKLFEIWSEDTEIEMAMNLFSMPRKIKYSTDTSWFGETQLRDFFSKVQSHFNMTSSTMDIYELWLEKGINGTLNEYFETVYLDLNSRDSWDAIGAPLYEAFGELTGAAGAPVDPTANLTWGYGRNQTVRDRYEESMERLLDYREWYNEYGMPNDPETCSESIYASTYMGSILTDRQPLTPFFASGDELSGPIWNTVLTAYGGVPEIIVPFGQAKYWSNNTLQYEYFPLSASFQAARGCDAVLFKLVSELAEAGLLQEVQTGKLAYPLKSSRRD